MALVNETIPDVLMLPDPDDRYVLAAAIRCNASVIVIFNERDFPPAALPELLVENLFDLDPTAVVAAAQRQRAQLKSLPMGVGRCINVLLRQGFVQTANSLTTYQATL